MEIKKLYPQGFCKGVNNAVLLAKQCLNDKTTKKPIYILGNIIHNQNVVDELNSLGAITLNNKNLSKIQLLDQINEGTVIFTAHGVSPQIYKLAKKKGLNIVDATCKDVLKIHQSIEKYININYKIFYIGTKNHAETDGVLGISKDIFLITNINDIPTVDINESIYVANQTTLSHYDLVNIYAKIKEKYKNAIIEDQICDATTKRQTAVLNQPPADLCIIVGDKLSSNSKKLYTLSKDICKINSILVDNLKDLYNFNFKDIKTINITSGASTPSILTNQIIQYLKKME